MPCVEAIPKRARGGAPVSFPTLKPISKHPGVNNDIANGVIHCCGVMFRILFSKNKLRNEGAATGI